MLHSYHEYLVLVNVAHEHEVSQMCYTAINLFAYYICHATWLITSLHELHPPIVKTLGYSIHYYYIHHGFIIYIPLA